METSNRIGILLFLHTRGELSATEQAELQDWRKESPANEELFIQMTGPDSLRTMMQEYYRERDNDFEKLKERLPELAGTSLSGSVENSAKNYAETLKFEESGGSNFLTDEFAASGLSPVAYWESVISCLDDDGGMEQEKETENYVAPKPSGTKKLRVVRKGRTRRRLLRVAAGIAGFFILSYFTADHRYDNYKADRYSPDEGKSTIGNDFLRGLYAGFAGITFGKTEKGEPIYIVPDEPSAKKDKFYTLKTAPGGMFILQLPDGTRIWMNESSTIKYPANFNQDTIRIQVEGEVNIENAKSPTHHFIITSPTHSAVDGESVFAVPPLSSLNINTNAGADEMLVTHTQGTSQHDPAMADNNINSKGGQQALVKHGNISGWRFVDANEVIAWKNGEFYFKDASVQTIMTAIANYYDMEIQYPSGIPDKKISLQVARSAPIEVVLGMLKMQGIRSSKTGRVVVILK
jgi:ferric-dicitrate binding protein FerR (iron transport regulator)